MFDFINFVRQMFSAENNDTPTGAEAVITDYNERKDLPEQGRSVVGTLDSVERCTVSGIFNENVVVNMVIDLGQYGEYTVTLDIEDELPEFMDLLNLEVGDLSRIVDGGYSIPMVRNSGEWRINWGEVDEGNVTEQEE